MLAIHIVMLEVSIRIRVFSGFEAPGPDATGHRLPLMIQQIRKREVVVDSVGLINVPTLKVACVSVTSIDISKVSSCLNRSRNVLETISADIRMCPGGNKGSLRLETL